MFCIDVRKRIKSKNKTSTRLKKKTPDSQVLDEVGDDNAEINEIVADYERRNSLPDVDDDFLPPLTLMTQQRSVTYGDLVDGNNQKLTNFSDVCRIFCQNVIL